MVEKVAEKAEKSEPKVEKAQEKKEVKQLECDDSFCPVHGKTRLHGRSLTGEVVKTKSHKTATILIQRQHFLKKYERYEKRRTKIQVHNPPCINAEVGDKVKVTETRPLSKTKHFIIVEVLK